jgi:hypothetical protein
MAFACIYCRKHSPFVTPSKAHIFPDALGGTTATRDRVCGDCNQQLNREVERPALNTFPFFRSILGIQSSRRNDIIRVRANFALVGPGVPAALTGQERAAFLNDQGQLDEVLVFKGTDATGGTICELLGPDERIESKRQEITQRHPDVQWEKVESERQLVWSLGSNWDDWDLTSAHLRRLATKVAFERFAQLRGSASLGHSEFDTVREFALIGNERESCCGVLSDPRLLDRQLNFPLPHHAVVIIEHPDDHILGAFVSFFALFYYWVVLSTRHRALAPMDDLLLEHPQVRKSDNPLLRLGVGSVRVPWWDW